MKKNTRVRSANSMRWSFKRFSVPVALVSTASLLFCSCQHGGLRSPLFSGVNAVGQTPVVEVSSEEESEIARSGFASDNADDGKGFSLSDHGSQQPAVQTPAPTQSSEPSTAAEAAEVIEGTGTDVAFETTDSSATFRLSDNVETTMPAKAPSASNIALVAYQEDVEPGDANSDLPPALRDLPVTGSIPLHIAPIPAEHPVVHGQVPAEVCPVGPTYRPHPMYPQELVSSYASMDEYLCDGGDRNQQVKIGEDFSITGLDLEDTIAHFDTLDGRRVIQPSNTVKIYAPRFGAVRQTHGVALNRSNQLIAKADKGVGAIPFQKNVASNTTLQHAQPISGIGAELANSFIDRDRANSFDRVDVLRGFNNEYGLHSANQIIRFRRMDQAQKARLAKDIMKAEFWTGDQSAQVVVDEKRISTTQSSQRLQDITGSEERVARRRMRIIKTASKGAAKPGDLIEFSIRFDNLSNERIGNVTVIDNLTPRLEYVPDSQMCSVKAEFLTKENEGGSLLLRWEITDPMEAETGGVVRFKCLVR